MSMDQPGEARRYSRALRVVGRHLDTEPARDVSMVEIEDGFTVRYHPDEQAEEIRTLHFNWERLMDLSIFHSAARGVPRRHDRHAGSWSEFPGGRQELYRALGAVLDDAAAVNLEVEELPGRLRVRYDVAGEPEGTGSDRQERMLGEDEMHALVVDARRRRGKSGAATES
jgi:hypothetical protein